LPALPDNLLSDGSSSLKLLVGGKTYQWHASYMIDWLSTTGKEEASKLQAAGILMGYDVRLTLLKRLLIKSWQCSMHG